MWPYFHPSHRKNPQLLFLAQVPPSPLSSISASILPDSHLSLPFPPLPSFYPSHFASRPTLFRSSNPFLDDHPFLNATRRKTTELTLSFVSVCRDCGSYRGPFHSHIQFGVPLLCSFHSQSPRVVHPPRSFPVASKEPSYTINTTMAGLGWCPEGGGPRGGAGRAGAGARGAGAGAAGGGRAGAGRPRQ